MKKKLVSLGLVFAMALTVTACGKDKNDTTTKSAVKPEEYAAQLQKDAEIYKKYVTLPNYKGIEVTVDRSSLEVTDEQVISYINTSILPNYAKKEEVTSGVTEVGDTVIMDFSGLLDGVPFSGGTATDYSYTVGSGAFIKDLDEGLVGLEIGKEYDIPCRFPDNYSADLAGKDVIFKVTIKNITKNNLPEYNDDFVLNNITNTEADVTNVAQFNEYVKNELKEQELNTFNNSKINLVFNQIYEATVISEYPQEKVDMLINISIDNIKKEFEVYGAQYNATDFTSYIKQAYGIESEEALKKEILPQLQEFLKEKMIVTLIAAEQGMTVSEQEILDAGTELATQYQYESYDAMVTDIGDTVHEEIGYMVLSEKVVNFLVENAVEK